MTQQSRAARTIGEMIARLHAIYLECWPDMDWYPRDDQLYPVAVRIEILKVLEDKRGQQSQPRRQTPLVRALRAARRELGKHRVAFVEGIPPEILEYVRNDLDRIDATRRQIEAELAAYEQYRVNPSRELMESILLSWEKTKLKVSKRVLGGAIEGDSPPDPLCLAVTKALCLAGVDYSPQTVSDLLRDRAHRRRSGMSRGRKIPRNAPINTTTRIGW